MQTLISISRRTIVGSSQIDQQTDASTPHTTSIAARIADICVGSWLCMPSLACPRAHNLHKCTVHELSHDVVCSVRVARFAVHIQESHLHGR